eukprot:s305_g9.t1
MTGPRDLAQKIELVLAFGTRPSYHRGFNNYQYYFGADTEASAELLGEEEELRSSYKGTNVQTIWLEDLRTAEEKGEKEDTIIDQLQQLWKLDNVTVLSVLLVVYTFIKELLPLFIEGVKNPLQDLPWQPGPIDQFPPSAF